MTMREGGTFPPSLGRRCPEGAEVGSRSNIFTRGNANPASLHSSAPSGHLPLKGKADDTRIPSSNMQRSRHESPEPKSLSMTKSQDTHPVCSGFSIGRRSRTVIFHFTQRRSTPESLAMSRGLAMCSFMPAFWARTTSSTKAFAVIARIGSALASLPGRRRIALVAS